MKNPLFAFAHISCAKSFVPLRKNTDKVLAVADVAVTNRVIALRLGEPLLIIRYADNPGAKIGNSVDVVIVMLV